MTLKIALKDQRAVIISYNARAENRGEDEHDPAADLGIEFDTGGDFLSNFDPRLKSAIFGPPGDGADLADKGSNSPTLIFPFLGPTLPIDLEMLGARASIALPKVKAPVALEDVKINKFAITPRQGGTVSVYMRLQFHPDDKQAGRLSTNVKEEVEVTIEPRSDDIEQAKFSEDPPASE